MIFCVHTSPISTFLKTRKQHSKNAIDEIHDFTRFLKIGQGKPECGRQSLEELMIRPIQRLPSITLLLNGNTLFFISVVREPKIWIKYTLRTNGGFDVESAVKQGCVLSPFI